MTKAKANTNIKHTIRID